MLLIDNLQFTLPAITCAVRIIILWWKKKGKYNLSYIICLNQNTNKLYCIMNYYCVTPTSMKHIIDFMIERQLFYNMRKRIFLFYTGKLRCKNYSENIVI